MVCVGLRGQPTFNKCILHIQICRPSKTPDAKFCKAFMTTLRSFTLQVTWMNMFPSSIGLKCGSGGVKALSLNKSSSLKIELLTFARWFLHNHHLVIHFMLHFILIAWWFHAVIFIQWTGLKPSSILSVTDIVMKVMSFATVCLRNYMSFLKPISLPYISCTIRQSFRIIGSASF